MPSQRDRMDEEQNAKPKRINRKCVAEQIRAFFQAAMQKQEKGLTPE